MNIRCLILACGNTLRSDDGVGPHLAAWAGERYAGDPNIKIISRQQWTPDLAEDIAGCEHVLFIDCSIESAPGSVDLRDVCAHGATQGLATHHIGAPALLALALELFGSQPRMAKLLTIGAGSMELGEGFSDVMRNAIPHACALLEDTVAVFLSRQTSADAGV